MCQKKFAERIKINLSYQVTFSETRAVYEIMWRNVVEPDCTHVPIYYGACVLCAGQLRL